MTARVRRDEPDGVHGRGQVAADQGQVGGLDRHVGAGAHGQPEVGLGQRGGVVHPVADHRDRPAVGLQPLDHVDLARPAAPRRPPR